MRAKVHYIAFDGEDFYENERACLCWEWYLNHKGKSVSFYRKDNTPFLIENFDSLEYAYDFCDYIIIKDVEGWKTEIEKLNVLVDYFESVGIDVKCPGTYKWNNRESGWVPMEV